MKKFSFVIGNPPYQEEKQGDSNTATPVYNDFIDAAYDISKRVMLITPARFLFNAGYTSKAWNAKMLNDKHLKVISYMADSGAVFNGVDIKGGVAITYHDLEKEFGAIQVFTQYPIMNTIIPKVYHQSSFQSMTKVIVSSFAYHYTKDFYTENPNFAGRASKGHEYDIQSNAFTVYPEAYLNDDPGDGGYVRILGREAGKRCFKYIKRNFVTNVKNLDSYKVFFPKATGTGQFGEILPESVLGYPGDGATVTFISIGEFSSKEEAVRCEKYVKTKFSRALLNVLKVTQDNTPGKWKYVPLQDFTTTSDIDWSRSIEEIDQQLYKKYGLTDEEIQFIETHVKEMN